MENWMTHFIEQFGYFGVLLLICIENIFPPIPSEVILTFSGFMTFHTNLTLTGVVIAATVGSVLGAMLLYGIGMLLDVERIEKITNRYGHILRVKSEDIERADRWFQKYGYWTVLFCRMIPIVRSLISLPAGMTRMNFPLFLIFTVIGTVMWNTLLVYLGAKVGESWTDIVHYFDLYSKFVYAIIALAGIIILFYWIRRSKRGA